MPLFPQLTPDGRGEALEIARDSGRRAVAAIRRTPGLLALSLVIGTALWIFVTDVENPTIVDTLPSPIPVEAVNVGDQLAVATQLPAVELRVAAPRDRWERLSPADFRAYVDMRDRDARRQEVLVQVETTVTGVRVVDTEPRLITVTLEDLVTAEVEVAARVIGTLPIGYELESATPEVETVRVIGPESLVARVTTAVGSVNVTGLTVGVEQAVTLQPQGAGGGEIVGVRLEPNTARIRVEITQRTLVRTVPLSIEVVGEPASGYRVSDVSISPSAVRIEGPIDALQQLDEIRLPSINISGARSDIVRSVAIPISPGIEVSGRDRATVSITVTPVIGAVRLPAPVDATGLGDGLQASFEPNSVDVLLEGPLPVLNALESGDIRAVVDLTGRGPGTWTITPEFTVNEGISAESMQPEVVTVTITAS
jgi:YbbR domain-containing protein